MASDSFGGLASLAPADPMQFTAWLDDALGRPLTIVALRRASDVGAAGEARDAPLAAWRAQLVAYPSVRLLAEELDDESGDEALARITQRDPDVLLVCAGATSDAAAAGGWCAHILDVAEGLNLFERMLLARCGVGVTRANARAAGYEDGFAPDQPLADALAILAHEAIAREMYRHRGSSPPCYL